MDDISLSERDIVKNSIAREEIERRKKSLGEIWHGKGICFWEIYMISEDEET